MGILRIKLSLKSGYVFKYTLFLSYVNITLLHTNNTSVRHLKYDDLIFQVRNPNLKRL